MSAGSRRGFTLIELVVAITVLAFVTMLLYTAFSTLKSSRDGLARIQDRYREGRVAKRQARAQTGDRARIRHPDSLGRDTVRHIGNPAVRYAECAAAPL